MNGLLIRSHLHVTNGFQDVKPQIHLEKIAFIYGLNSF